MGILHGIEFDWMVLGWDQHDIFFRVDRWGAALFLFNLLMTIMTNWLLDVINWTSNIKV
jgi:hypothetical protein